MKPKRRKRLLLIFSIIIAVTIAVALMLYALKKNINLFYTPTQVVNGQAPINHVFRLGGLVAKGSIKQSKKTVLVKFKLTDKVNTVSVQYNGILPGLFREGQGIVAQGHLNAKGVFVADQVLAKHDADYMPPNVKYALQQAKKEITS